MGHLANKTIDKCAVLLVLFIAFNKKDKIMTEPVQNITQLDNIISKLSTSRKKIASEKESKKIASIIEEGYDIAYGLMSNAARNKNVELFKQVYDSSKCLLDNVEYLNSVVLHELKKYKNRFYNEVASIIVLHKPDFLLIPTVNRIQESLTNTTDEQEQSLLHNQLDTINYGVGVVHIKNGIKSEYAFSVFKQIDDRLQKAKQNIR